jgi:hypothetical protein
MVILVIIGQDFEFETADCEDFQAWSRMGTGPRTLFQANSVQRPTLAAAIWGIRVSCGLPLVLVFTINDQTSL